VGGQQAEMRRMLDEMDARAAARKVRVRPAETALGKESPAVLAALTRLQTKRATAGSAWDTTFRATYRKELLGLPTMSAKNVGDGSYAREVAAARARLVSAVATPRLAAVKDMRAAVARERAAATSTNLQKYLDQRTARYAKVEAALTRALANPAANDREIQDALLPRSFAGKITRSTAVVP
jgi:hypothetical protein